MRHEDNVGYKMRLIHNRIHKQMEAKRIENEGNITGMQRWTLGFLNDRADTEIYQKDIEQEFKVSRATASNMLQLMERKSPSAKVKVIFFYVTQSSFNLLQEMALRKSFVP